MSILSNDELDAIPHGDVTPTVSINYFVADWVSTILFR